MTDFKNLSIRRKLMLIVMLASGLALLFMAVISMTQQWLAYRGELINAVNSQASVIAINSTSAILAGDMNAAQTELAALKMVDYIQFAKMYDKAGKLFAIYVHGGGIPSYLQQRFALPADAPGVTYLDSYQPIVSHGQQIGSIYLRVSLLPVYERMAWGMLVTLGAALGGLGVAFVLIAGISPAIVGPMENLLGLMRTVSTEKNYALRSFLRNKDEIGALADEFNNMLDQIEARDFMLEQHRMHLEQEVARRTASLTEAQRIAHLGNWEWDIGRDVLTWSDEIYQIFGLAPQQFGANYAAFMQAVHPDDRELVEQQVRDALKQDHAYSIDHRILRPDGSVRYVREQGKVSSVSGGEPVWMLGTVHDITEYKLIENALVESEKRFRDLVEQSSDWVWETDAQGIYSYVSPQCQSLLGYAAHEVVGKSPLAFMPPVEAERVSSMLEQSIQAYQPFWRLESIHVHKDGHLVVLETNGAPIFDLHGEFRGYRGMDRDISDRKRAEESTRKLNEVLESKVQERTRQLQETQEELLRKEKLAVLGQVAGSVGHELRNPLGVMSNAVYFLQAVLPDAEDTTREYLGIIKNEIAVADRIVGDLLDSVRTKPAQPQTVAVTNLIEQVLNKCDVPASVTIQQDIPEALPFLWVDPMQVGQILRNLISNGIEAMPAGGTLTIHAAACARQMVSISVQDSGVGMTAEHLAKLFQPLFTTKAKGIGLGLVVVKNLAQANGGSVSVMSEAGKGTTFTVTLPCVALPAEVE